MRTKDTERKREGAQAKSRHVEGPLGVLLIQKLSNQSTAVGWGRVEPRRMVKIWGEGGGVDNPIEKEDNNTGIKEGDVTPKRQMEQ